MSSGRLHSNLMSLISHFQRKTATLSTGPVAPGDRINYTSVDNIMHCYRQGGVILKPGQPLTVISTYKLILYSEMVKHSILHVL